MLAEYFAIRGVEGQLMSKEIKKEEWVRRTTVGEPRLSEIVELYKSLGYEVRIEPVTLDEVDEDCRRCYKNDVNKVGTVYVRKKEIG